MKQDTSNANVIETSEEAPRIEAISETVIDQTGDDCMGCAGKPYC